MEFKIGMKVIADPDDPRTQDDVRGRVFTVHKVNPKRVQCTADDGGRGINYSKDLLIEATDENVKAAQVLGRPYEPPEFFYMGEIVTMKRPYKDWTTETPLIVMADKGQKVNVALLGGDGDRYVRAVGAGLVKRDLAWLRERLADELPVKA
jgi:hypothetical protein